jgi:hypothetical protein
MSQDVTDYFEELAHSAIERCHARVADRKFFESVKARIARGEDLSEEIQQLRGVSKKDALFVVNQLIKRCDTDMVGYWSLPGRTTIESAVNAELVAGELVPRFTARYTVQTEVGKMTVTLANQGNHTDISLNASEIKAANRDTAMRELANQLLVARMTVV